MSMLFSLLVNYIKVFQYSEAIEIITLSIYVAIDFLNYTNRVYYKIYLRHLKII